MSATTDMGESRALHALEISGRRLARLRDGRWGVLPGNDRRHRPIIALAAESVERLVAQGALMPADGDAYVLAVPEHRREPPAPALRWVFVAASMRRPGARSGGVGFAGLATLAREGRGPLSLRQVQAGLKLVRDAERAAADTRMTMNWDAGPVTRQRRSGSQGGWRADARKAAHFLHRLREHLGETLWRLLWALCVDCDSLSALKKRFGIPSGNLHRVIAEALENLVEAYDSQRAP